MKNKILLTIITIILFPKIAFAANIDLTPNAKSAILMEADSGTILFQKNAHEKLAPASMTKVMTMLLIMESLEKNKLTLKEELTISKDAASMGGSQIFLEEGEKMTVENLLKGVAIGSANDAAYALAERISGTESTFVDQMNNRLKELKLKNTNFKNTTGLDEANHYSTASDMAYMAKELVKHKEILKYTAIYEDYLREDREESFWLVNTNKVVCEKSIKYE